MNHKRLSALTASGVLALGLVLGAPTSANAKVKAKDVPTKAQIVKAFPALKGGTFQTSKQAKVAVPGKKCGAVKAQKVKSGFSNTGVASAGSTVVTTGVAEFKSKAAAKKYLKKYKKFVTKCKSFKESTTGAKVTIKKVKAPKLGNDRIALTQTTSYSGYTAHSASVVVLKGKRLAEVSAVNSAKIPAKQINKLAKVATKKM